MDLSHRNERWDSAHLNNRKANGRAKGTTMLHVIIGLVAIVIGLWGIGRNWFMFKDILFAFVPLAAICFGVVALLAGIRSMKAKIRE